MPPDPVHPNVTPQLRAQAGLNAANLTRRKLLLGGLASATASLHAAEQDRELQGKALIAITLDLEMSRNFPTRETTHWDYEKGNLILGL